VALRHTPTQTATISKIDGAVNLNTIKIYEITFMRGGESERAQIAKSLDQVVRRETAHASKFFDHVHLVVKAVFICQVSP
jgi:hypothetical protein